MINPAMLGVVAAGRRSSSDPSFGNVILLLHCDGADGSGTLTDSSSYNHTNFSSGPPNIETDDFMFGGASLYFPQTIGRVWYETTLTNLSGIDFCIEFWLKEETGSQGSVLSRRQASTAAGWSLTAASLRAKINGTWSDTQMTWTRPSLNAWHHIAWTCSGTTMRIFVDGAIAATKTGVTSIEDVSIQSIVFGVGDDVNEFKLKGYIDEFRWTRGAARYTADFTPAGPFPNS